MYRTTRTAVRALRRNVLRSVLTCLGIIIGIAAVIALVEIGTGAGVAIQTAISKFGANIIMVFPGEASNNGVSFGTGTRVTLTPEDCQAIATECPAVRNAAPNVFARLQIVYENRNWQPNNIYGTTPAYLDVGNWEIAEGEAFTDHDVQSVRLVCLIGQTVAKQLFEDEDPIGKEIRVKNANLKVIGVLASKGANMMGWDQDDTLIAPWTTVRFRLSNQMLSNTNQSAALAANSNPFTAINSLNNWYPTAAVTAYPQPSSAQQADTPQPIRFNNIDQVLVSARSPLEIPAAVHQITTLLRDRHHLQPGQPDDFQVLNISEFLKALTTATAMMTNLLLCVALISLLVGGVGIMNIM
ncbi:MAG TPA: ABC transporter permease, partial [Tepidisphaeraceae bacterium]|nr:ABC transporter permease [Tepidisphaeraceae bacterium]